MPVTTTKPVEEDLPPGVQASNMGGGRNPVTVSSVAGFLASGQKDVNKYLAPPPAIVPTPTPAPTASPAQGWADRASQGMLRLFGLDAPSPTPTPIPDPVLTPPATALLPVPVPAASPVYKQRLEAYNQSTK